MEEESLFKIIEIELNSTWKLIIVNKWDVKNEFFNG
jgi:hypothetical protein